MPDNDPPISPRVSKWPPAREIDHAKRSVDERLEDLELVVYGNERQRIKGLIDSLSDMRSTVDVKLATMQVAVDTIGDDLRGLKDNRGLMIQIAVSVATFATSAFALYWALRHP